MALPIGLGPEAIGPEIRLDIERPGQGERTEESGSIPFSERLRQFAAEVQDTQATADQSMHDFAEGRNDDIHGTMIQMQQADIQFRLATNIRNRVIEAYREVLRMGA